MNKHVILLKNLSVLIPFLALFLLPVSSTATEAAETICPPTRISGPIGYPSHEGDIYGDYVAYSIVPIITESDDIPEDVFLYQISTGITQRVTKTQDIAEYVVALSNEYIAIRAYGMKMVDLFLYEIATGEMTRITQNEATEYDIRVRGDYLVWHDGGYDSNDNPVLHDVNIYQISTGELTTLMLDPNDQIFWLDFEGYDIVTWSYLNATHPKGTIALYRISTGEFIETALDPDPNLYTSGPNLSENFIVWEESNPLIGIQPEIWLYDISMGEIQRITNDNYHDEIPLISGDYISWTRDEGQSRFVVLYQISTGSLTALTDSTTDNYHMKHEGDLLVYVDDELQDVYLYQISTGEKKLLIDHLIHASILPTDFLVDIHNNNLIWSSVFMQDLYLYQHNNPASIECGQNLLTNHSFEDGFNGWQGTGLTRDKVKCADEEKFKNYGFHGFCGFRFKGSINENSRISQKVKLKEIPTASGDELTFGVWFMPVVTTTRGQIRITVNYTDGSMTKHKLRFPAVTGGGFTMMIDTLTFEKTPRNFSFEIINRTSNKEVRIDRAFAFIQAGGDTYALPNGLIPLPDAPQPSTSLRTRAH